MVRSDVLRRTQEAATYLIETYGIPCSPHTLRKWRRRGPDDAGEHGPEWLVDPETGYTLYPQSALDRFGEERRARLIKQRNLQPARLSSQSPYSVPPVEPNSDESGSS
jgi:hypothetical protein